MNIGSMFLLFIAGFAGAFVHYLKQNTVGKVDLGEALGFWQWLLAASPIKAFATWMFLVAGIIIAAILGDVTANFLGFALAFLYGYFLDSLFKRYTEKKEIA